MITKKKMHFIAAIILSLFEITTVYASHHPENFLRAIAGTKNEGKQIVQHYCAVCHSKQPMIPLGAPRVGEAADWDYRLKSGLETLINHMNEGFNAMPPRGGCFECSDQQLMIALFAMLPKSTRDSLSKDLKDYKKNK